MAEEMKDQELVVDAPVVDDDEDKETEVQRIARENHELRERLAKMEGRLEGAAPKKEEVPEFESEQDEFNYKLLQHSKALEAKLRKLEERSEQAEREAAAAKVISKAMRGLNLGKQADFAKEHMSLFIRLHPDADPSEIREHAKKVAVSLGVSAEKGYVEDKKADAGKTQRPAAAAPSVPVTAPQPRVSAAERMAQIRAEALAKLRAAN